MQKSNRATPSKKSPEKSQQHETLSFKMASEQSYERASDHQDRTLQRDWGRSGGGISGQGITGKAQSSRRDSPMLQRWRKEIANEQPFNAIGAAERGWGYSGGGVSGQGTTSQAQYSPSGSPMLQRWWNETAKEQPYNDIGAVGVRSERSFAHQREGEKS